MMRILLVEPRWPTRRKSKNHNGFLPIGLLKLASYHRKKGAEVALAKGPDTPLGFVPDRILVTSLFTYWAEPVREVVQHYKALFPSARVTVGGIYASLMPEHCKSFTGCDEVFVGVHSAAEKLRPAYDLVETDLQIIHASRGCLRHCSFCGTWLLEPDFVPKRTIKKEIVKSRVLFYDNNFLANPHIDIILDELTAARVDGKPVRCESQSGLDGRILLKRPELAVNLKRARFEYPRIAWDGPFHERGLIEEQILILRAAGFREKDTYVFMVYNWDLPFEEMERKRLQCAEWGVQVADCRFRPLDQISDRYKPGAPGAVSQSRDEYYIHPKWSDLQVRQFRRNVREQNITIRLGRAYSRETEQWGRRRARGNETR